jgi:phosphoserine aminotransferase
MVGRSHRAEPARARIQEISDRSRAILGIPADWRLGVVPASDTGAVELALWSLLGPRGVDLLAWESFGSGWVSDAVKQLKLADARVLESDYGKLPDLGAVDFDRDVVFTWNGTTSGVRVPNADWIPADRRGLAICDATSAVFAMDVRFDKLDVVTWSWQKVLGGEAAHGMLALSPRAVERLESYQPPWPMPKLFRLTNGGKLDQSIFEGSTINTPSMLCVEDALDSLRWAEAVGGLPGLIARSEANLATVARWEKQSSWAEFLAADPAIRSCTSICLRLAGDFARTRDAKAVANAVKTIVKKLDAEGVAHDVGSYRDAPPGIRLWGGATVETSDLAAVLPWLDWAFAEATKA